MQTVIAGKTVYLQGAKITPAQVVDHKRVQLRSEVPSGTTEAGAFQSDAAKTRTMWRETWDMEYFLKALEETYAVSEVDKFAEAGDVWRKVLAELQKSIQVDASNAGALSLSCTAVLVETNYKHRLPTESEDYVLKYLPRVFVSTYNDHNRSDANKAFSDELKEDLRADKDYKEKQSLRRLIVKRQKAQARVTRRRRPS